MATASLVIARVQILGGDRVANAAGRNAVRPRKDRRTKRTRFTQERIIGVRRKEANVRYPSRDAGATGKGARKRARDMGAAPDLLPYPTMLLFRSSLARTGSLERPIGGAATA
jgi:hypothetical protein